MRAIDTAKAKQKDIQARENVKRNNVVHLQYEIEVRAQLGGIFRQTFYTLVKSGRFPKPTILIGSKKFWSSAVAPAFIAAAQQLKIY
jgi:predicted DNA-binding transcriptional regulator AlpA